MTALDAIRTVMVSHLKKQGIHAIAAWPAQGRSRCEEVLAAVSIRACEGGPAGFQHYLGERYNAETGRWEELYGREMKVSFGLDLYADRQLGELACEAVFDRLMGALQPDGPAGLTVLEVSRGETRFQSETGLLVCPVSALCAAYLYAVADEGGTFLDFEVKGAIL